MLNHNINAINNLNKKSKLEQSLKVIAFDRVQHKRTHWSKFWIRSKTIFFILADKTRIRDNILQVWEILFFKLLIFKAYFCKIGKYKMRQMIYFHFIFKKIIIIVDRGSYIYSLPSLERDIFTIYWWKKEFVRGDFFNKQYLGK